MTTEILELTEEIKNHLQANIHTEDYKALPGEYCQRNGKWGYFIDFDKVGQYYIKTAIRNLKLIKDRIKTRSERTEILQGDVIRYKNGTTERVTHVWHDGQIQAGGGSGSYYMHKSGTGEYSGGLNSGLHISKLKLTDQTEPHSFWLFSKDWAGGNRSIYFKCPVKVWEEI
jgi:hypothetical protein